MPARKQYLEVVACLLIRRRKVLIAQRQAGDHYGLLWEFPGGKVEAGETQPEALRREMKEELGLEIKVGRLWGVFFDEDERARIKVYLYRCFDQAGRPQAKECAAFRFVGRAGLRQAKLAPLDVKIRDFLEKKWQRIITARQ